MRFSLVLGMVGRLLRVFAFTFLAPALLAGIQQDWTSTWQFTSCGALALSVGHLFVQLSPAHNGFRRAEALGVTGLTWLVIALFSSIPYLFQGFHPADAYFESMSGLTTTGATILTQWDLPSALFLWRSMTQWFGGIGVIALFVVVLPHLGVGGRQLFFAEASSATSESVAPKIRATAARLWLLYGFLTILEVVLLHIWAGMPLFDSFCHGLTTISSGGFSPNAASIAGYAVPGAFPNYNPVIGEWIIVCFMLMAGMSFPLLWIALSRRPTAVLRDGEFRLYIFLAALFSLILVGLIPNGNPNLDTLRKGAFQCASLMSSTGYASADYNLWGDPAITALLLAMFLGGCAGSAVGGPKLLRLLLSVKFLFREMTRVLHPRAVITIRHRDAKVSERIMRAVFTVVSLYIAGYVVVGSCMVLLGAPVREGFSAALACLGNIGPAFGDLGPMGNYQGLSSAQKILLSGAMWFGRLEIVSALALFHPDLLRHIRWGHGDPHPPRA